jgi:hypothetical protein
LSDKVGTFDQRIARANDRADKAMEGVAVALSLADPVLANGDTLGIRFSWGTYGGEQAIGTSIMGVLSSNTFGNGESLSIGGGVGVGLSDGNVGGRVGLQLTWK